MQTVRKCFSKLLAKNLSHKERQQLGFVAEDALRQYARHDGSFLEFINIVFTCTEKTAVKCEKQQHWANFSRYSPYNFAQECVIKKTYRATHEYHVTFKALFSSYGAICSPWNGCSVESGSFDDNSEAAHGRLLLKLIRTTTTADRVSRNDQLLLACRHSNNNLIINYAFRHTHSMKIIIHPNRCNYTDLEFLK